MRKVNYDVAIVGAGPAGLRLAARLSGKGYRLGLFEAKPDYKTGAHILMTPRSIVTEATGGDESAVVLCTKFVTGSIRSYYRFKYPQARDCMVETSTVLEALSHHIGDSELHFRHRVTNIHATSEGVLLEISAPEGMLECSCKILAACDGVNSITNKTFGGGPKFLPGTEYYLDGVKADPGCFYNFHTHRYSPGLYVCIFNISPTQVVVGLGWGGHLSPKQLLEAFISEHPVAVELGLRWGKVTRRAGGLTAISKGLLTQGRVIFLGDAAAGYPWLGGIMYDGAIKSADIAAEPILRALATNDPSLLKDYEAAWDEAFAKRFQFEAELRGALHSLTDDEIDAVISDFKGDGSLRKAIIVRAKERASHN